MSMLREVEPDLHGDPRLISSHGTERLNRMGFEISKTRNGAPLDGVVEICIDKSNVTRGHQLFISDKVAEKYPDVLPIMATLTPLLNG